MLKDREMLDTELRDKIELYSELTGQDGWNVPITKVADFMSGFEMGKEKFRKRGHWIAHPKGIYAHLICDKCLSGAPYDCETNYCPNCGADMRGE